MVTNSLSMSLGLAVAGSAAPARVTTRGPNSPALACACCSTSDRYSHMAEELSESAAGPACAFEWRDQDQLAVQLCTAGQVDIRALRTAIR